MFGALTRHALSTTVLRRSTASTRRKPLLQIDDRFTALIALSSLEIHSSAQAYALSKFSMPAMSPTMTEGGIANWKKKEGESFAVGDVLLEIVSNSFHRELGRKI